MKSFRIALAAAMFISFGAVGAFADSLGVADSLDVADSIDAAPTPPEEHFDCVLHENSMGAPIVHLTAAAIDSIGTAISDRNVAFIDHINAAYLEGKYGKLGTSSAKNAALSAFIYGAITAFDFVSKLAVQHEVIYETAEEDLQDAFTTKFRNPGFYPVINLESAKTGFGRYCLTFKIDGPPREITVAGEMMKCWPQEVDLKGVKTHVLIIDMKTFSYDRVQVVYERHSQGAILSFEEGAGGHPLIVEAMEEISGQYVRKWGFHTVNAVTMWRTKVEELGTSPKKGAHLNAGIYFPSIKVEMPWFLPDLGFDDLRTFEYPEPLLTLDAVHALQAKKLDWVKVKKDMRFAKWEGDGEIPDVLKQRYPDK